MAVKEDEKDEEEEEEEEDDDDDDEEDGDEQTHLTRVSIIARISSNLVLAKVHVSGLTCQQPLQEYWNSVVHSVDGKLCWWIAV